MPTSLEVSCMFPNEHAAKAVLQRAAKYVENLYLPFYDIENRAGSTSIVPWGPDDISNSVWSNHVSV